MAFVRVVERSTIYRGAVIRVVREVLEVDGHRLVRETIEHPGAVVVVPVLEDGRLIFVRQYRRAVRRELLELPAGTLAKGESSRACAARELEEETGWRARRLHRVGQFYAAPGFISEQLTVFLAQRLIPSVARPEPDEFVRPIILDLKTALAKVRSGAICDAKTIIGVLSAKGWLAEHRAR